MLCNILCYDFFLLPILYFVALSVCSYLSILYLSQTGYTVVLTVLFYCAILLRYLTMLSCCAILLHYLTVLCFYIILLCYLTTLLLCYISMLSYCAVLLCYLSALSYYAIVPHVFWF